MSDYPDPETWEYAGPRQAKRAARSFDALAKRAVPVYRGPLFVDDDEEAKVQPASEVARRALILWAVNLHAERIPHAETLAIVDHLDLWKSVSPLELVFLRNENPSSDECQRLAWRLESIWVLLWALNHLQELDWPSSMCDVPKLAALLSQHESDVTFITSARLRSLAEILDAQDLILRVHWAIRDCLLHQGGMMPENLVWSEESEYIPRLFGTWFAEGGGL